jgi:hypothetical protein
MAFGYTEYRSGTRFLSISPCTFSWLSCTYIYFQFVKLWIWQPLGRICILGPITLKYYPSEKWGQCKRQVELLTVRFFGCGKIQYSNSNIITNSVGTWTFRTLIWHQWPLSIMYGTLSLKNWTLLTADKILFWRRRHVPNSWFIIFFPYKNAGSVSPLPIWPSVLPLNITFILVALSHLSLPKFLYKTFHIPCSSFHVRFPELRSFTKEIHASASPFMIFRNRLFSSVRGY